MLQRSRPLPLHLVTVPLLGLAVAACSTTSPGEAKRATEGKIVNGTESTEEHDATIFIANAVGACTGTMIAPNLVLTAAHCVVDPGPQQGGEGEEQGGGGEGQGGEDELGTGFKKTPAKTTSTTKKGGGPAAGGGDCPFVTVPAAEPSSLRISVGAQATFGSEPVAAGKQIFIASAVDRCVDLALILLDRDVEAPIAKVRFSELAPGEGLLAVGYGIDGRGNPNAVRMQRETRLLGVGPTEEQYETADGKTVSYEIPEGDLATGESTCNGDSGGPLFDQSGAVVAVTSRGIPEQVEGDHGEGNCIDLPALYASTRAAESIIRQAAKAAGHEID